MRYPLLLSHAVSFLLYRQQTSPRVSDWKSQGETRTMSPCLIQTLLFIFPRILQRRSWPSWHFTNSLSKPSSLAATPNTSVPTGNCIRPKSVSLTTFLLPIVISPLSRRNSFNQVSFHKKNHILLRLGFRARSWPKLWRTAAQLAMMSRASNSRFFTILRNPNYAAYSAALWTPHVVA